MAEERAQRRLAAILAADVVGYSRLMEEDEAGTLAALKARRRNILAPSVAQHHGRLVKVMGDGVLVEFASAVDAVECAIEMQKRFAEANERQQEDRSIVLRIGINLGDVIVEGGDLYGDGINVAARLEAIAEPGGVCLSHAVVSHVRGKTPHGFEDLGERSLKNIAEPVRVYRVSGAASSGVAPSAPTTASRLSIAVLPFTNMSGDPEQEYFSDGIAEDIITDLSKVSALRVLSRNTAFAFKGKAADIGQIAEKLKVSHVVEGSVRKAGGRVRITAQLIDANKDSHLWAERYDRELNDIFALQDEISRAIVTALKIKLMPDERKAIENRSTQDSKAYQLYLLARFYQTQYGVRTLRIALRFCRNALKIDPNYGRAWALTAICEAFLYLRGSSEEPGLSAAEKALSLDSTLAGAYAAKGLALCLLGQNASAIAAHQESLRLEPDSYDVRSCFGSTCMQLGRYDAAIEHFELAAQLLEADYTCLCLLAACRRALGQHEESKSTARLALARIEKEVALRPDNAHAIVMGAIELGYLGERERAGEWTSRALAIESDDIQDHYNLACALALLGAPEHSLSQLEKYVGEMPPARINWIKRDSDLAPLHSHPRYIALIARAETRFAAFQVEQAAKATEIRI